MNTPIKFFILSLIFCLSVLIKNDKRIVPEVASFVFENKLSAYGLDLLISTKALSRTKNIFNLEWNASSFSAFAQKEGGVKLPVGKKMLMLGDGNFKFPSGTILYQTYYYLNSAGAKKMLETRILVLNGLVWNPAVYKWNENQTDAQLISKSEIIWIDDQQHNPPKQISYSFPSNTDCKTCHNNDGKIVPLGTKGINLNMQVEREGLTLNQLDYLESQGAIELAGNVMFWTKPSYNDTTFNIEQRARSYLDVNCAHCHNPQNVSKVALNLAFTIPLAETGIHNNKQSIIEKMEFPDSNHKPLTGTTRIDSAGVRLVKQLITRLDKTVS